ncbi:MAG TPA: transglycosylase SLT domain-containing protein [Burkholderiales bacterium]|nr:transglycosylase SLT domain-containing protein [Burkholderiales bacterium]
MTLTLRLIAGITLLFAAAVCCASQDDDFLAARDAFRDGDAATLARYAAQLKGYLLEPYVEYWQIKRNLDQATADEVRAVLNDAKNDGPLEQEIRADWLEQLGKNEQWDLFAAEYPKLLNPNTELQCYWLQTRLAARSKDDEAVSEARDLWLTGKRLPESCDTVFELLAQQGDLPQSAIWKRLRLALKHVNTVLARQIGTYLPDGEAPSSRALKRAASSPLTYLRRHLHLESRAGRELAIFAVEQIARSSPESAAAQWEKLGPAFPAADRDYVWGRIGFHAALQHDPQALEWYGHAHHLSGVELAWKARAALRAGNWPAVLAAIDAMSPQERSVDAWRYWKARALKAQGKTADADALLVPLSAEFGFYAQLATEELGRPITLPRTNYTPSDKDIEAVSDLPGIQRALAFYRLDLRYNGTKEWVWAIRGFGDKKLLAAAELARRNHIYDRAINTANKTIALHDVDIRFLAPYRDVLKAFSERQQLSLPWVYGLIRQESRFIADIRSSAGAAGLMQLMPGTAKWIAKKLGIQHFHWGEITEPKVNANFGTFYLRHVLDLLNDNPVLASAGYNAGPNRARRWVGDKPMEGAIYIETIPFSETRRYVKKVMSNTVYYAYLFNAQDPSLKQLLGVIQPWAPPDADAVAQDK